MVNFHIYTYSFENVYENINYWSKKLFKRDSLSILIYVKNYVQQLS